ncbi:MAG: hypothetical protein V4449_01685 [Patescibacteria group bacterium]
MNKSYITSSFGYCIAQTPVTTLQHTSHRVSDTPSKYALSLTTEFGRFVTPLFLKQVLKEK